MPFLAMLADLLLDVDVDAGRQIDAHQRVNGLRCRVKDVDQPLVGAHFEMLPRILVLMRRANDAVHVLLSGQRHRAHHAGAGPDNCLDDFARRGVNGLVVVGLEPDADLLSRHASPTSLSRSGPGVPPGADRLYRSGVAPGCCAAVYLSWSTGPRGRVCRPHAAWSAIEIRRVPRLGPDAPGWAPVVGPTRPH